VFFDISFLAFYFWIKIESLMPIYGSPVLGSNIN